MKTEEEIIKRLKEYKAHSRFWNKSVIKELEWVLNAPSDYCEICDTSRKPDDETGLSDTHGHF